MLKIKDNVDLKELEKFGFYDSLGIYQKNLETHFKGGFSFNDFMITVIKESRIIRYHANKEIETYNLDTLYDLIKVDLVEKVEDKGE